MRSKKTLYQLRDKANIDIFDEKQIDKAIEICKFAIKELNNSSRKGDIKGVIGAAEFCLEILLDGIPLSKKILLKVSSLNEQMEILIILLLYGNRNCFNLNNKASKSKILEKIDKDDLQDCIRELIFKLDDNINSYSKYEDEEKEIKQNLKTYKKELKALTKQKNRLRKESKKNYASK